MNQDISSAIVDKRNDPKNQRIDVIAYERVSTSMQGEKGVSLEDQRIQMEAGEKEKGYNIVETFTDVHSARNEHEGCKRPGLNQAMKLAHDLSLPILIPRADRFTRTYATYQRYEEKGGVLLVLELGLDAPVERIRFAIQHAEEEIEQRLRTAAIGRRKAVANGKKFGNPDLAPARVKSLTVRKKNALGGYKDFERHLADARARGAVTLRELAREFNKAGFRTRRGRKWKAANVKQKIDIIAKLKAAARGSNPARIVSAKSANAIRALALLAKFRRAATEEAAESNVAAGNAIQSDDEHTPSLSPPSMGNDNTPNALVDTAPPLASDHRGVDKQGAARTSLIPTLGTDFDPTKHIHAPAPEPANANAKPPEGFPLTPDELEELRTLFVARGVDEERARKLLARAAHPRLTERDRKSFIGWVVRWRSCAA